MDQLSQTPAPVPVTKVITRPVMTYRAPWWKRVFSWHR